MSLTRCQGNQITFFLKHLGLSQIQQGGIQESDLNSYDLAKYILIIDCLAEGHGVREVSATIEQLHKISGFALERTVWLLNVSDDLSHIPNVISWPNYMTNHCEWLDHVKSLDHDFSTVDRHVLCIARRPSPSRAKFMKSVINRVSGLVYSYGTAIDYRYYDNILKTEVPIYLDGPTKGLEQHRATDPRLFSCLINLVIETSNQTDPDSWNSEFITEKSFKPLAWRQLPVWWAVPGHVQRMRNMDFDVFDDLIDHGYDTITDPDLRQQAVLNTVSKLIKNTKDFRQIKKDVWQRLQNNWHKLCDMDAERLTRWKKIKKYVDHLSIIHFKQTASTKDIQV